MTARCDRQSVHPIRVKRCSQSFTSNASILNLRIAIVSQKRCNTRRKTMESRIMLLFFGTWLITSMLVCFAHADSLPMGGSQSQSRMSELIRSTSASTQRSLMEASLRPDPYIQLGFTTGNKLFPERHTMGMSILNIREFSSSQGLGEEGNESVAIPEPASLFLVGSGLVGIATLLRKTRLI